MGAWNLNSEFRTPSQYQTFKSSVFEWFGFGMDCLKPIVWISNGYSLDNYKYGRYYYLEYFSCWFFNRTLSIDDIFIKWTGTEEEFLTFSNKLNEMHPTIKFTHSYNLTTRWNMFLDTQVTIDTNNQITTDLYNYLSFIYSFLNIPFQKTFSPCK